MTAMLEAKDLEAGYGDAVAVRGVDLHVSPGEVVGLLGPNGAGKTTTMMTLGGLLRPQGGTVTFAGAPLTGPLHRRARRGLSFITEQRSVFMQLPVATNLKLGRGPVDRALELFPELVPLLDRPAGLCSGGEQQILTLARALAAEPKVLLVDELSLGLAPRVVTRLLNELRAAAVRGVAVLVVEQHARTLLRHADRAYVLHRGRIALEGSAVDLLDRLDEIETTYLSGGGTRRRAWDGRRGSGLPSRHAGAPLL